MKKSLLNALEQLIEEILKIRGGKIITLVTDDLFKIDIDEEGKFGYHPSHREVFNLKLQKALRDGGGMVIREFLPLKVKQRIPDGKEIWIPEKNLYGVYLGDQRWMGMSAEEVQHSHETDSATGKPIPREEGVHYKAFPLNS